MQISLFEACTNTTQNTQKIYYTLDWQSYHIYQGESNFWKQGDQSIFFFCETKLWTRREIEGHIGTRREEANKCEFKRSHLQFLFKQRYVFFLLPLASTTHLWSLFLLSLSSEDAKEKINWTCRCMLQIVVCQIEYRLTEQNYGLSIDTAIIQNYKWLVVCRKGN